LISLKNFPGELMICSPVAVLVNAYATKFYPLSAARRHRNCRSGTAPLDLGRRPRGAAAHSYVILSR